MTEHRGPDAKKVYSFRFSPNDLIHWRLAAESRGLTLNAWIERNNNISLYDFALGLIDAGTYPGRRSKLMGLQAQLLIDARRKEDGDTEPPTDVHIPLEPSGITGTEGTEVHRAGAWEDEQRDDSIRGRQESDRQPQRAAQSVEPQMYFADTTVYPPESQKSEPAPTGNGGKPEPELAKQILAKRGCCVHGTQRGFHCWQCRGKAKIAGDPETLSKREQAKAEREQAKASKKKGKGRR